MGLVYAGFGLCLARRRFGRNWFRVDSFGFVGFVWVCCEFGFEEYTNSAKKICDSSPRLLVNPTASNNCDPLQIPMLGLLFRRFQLCVNGFHVCLDVSKCVQHVSDGSHAGSDVVPNISKFVTNVCGRVFRLFRNVLVDAYSALLEIRTISNVVANVSGWIDPRSCPHLARCGRFCGDRGFLRSGAACHPCVPGTTSRCRSPEAHLLCNPL